VYVDMNSILHTTLRNAPTLEKFHELLHKKWVKHLRRRRWSVGGSARPAHLARSWRHCEQLLAGALGCQAAAPA